LVNWLKEIRLKGWAWTKRPNFWLKEGETWPVPWEATLDPLARVMKLGVIE